MSSQDSRRQVEYLYSSQQSSPLSMYQYLDRTIKKETDSKKFNEVQKFQQESYSKDLEFQRILMQQEGKQLEIEKLTNQIIQLQLKNQYQSQLECNNKQLNTDLDTLDNKYGQLLNDLKDSLEECDKWKTRSVRLEQQNKDHEQLKNQLMQYQESQDQSYELHAQLEQLVNQKQDHLSNSLLEITKLVEQQTTLEKVVTQLEQDLLKVEKLKGIQLNEQSNQHIIEVSKLSYHQKYELNELKNQLTQSNTKIKELQLITQEQGQKNDIHVQKLSERDQLTKQLKKEIDGLQKKISNNQEDHHYDIKKLKQQTDERIQSLQEEYEDEKGQNQKTLQLRDETILQKDKQAGVLNQSLLKLQSYVSQFEEHSDQQKISIQEFEIKLSEEAYNNQQQQILMTQLNEQDLSKLKLQLQLTQDNCQKEIDSLQARYADKDKLILARDTQVKQLTVQRDKEKLLQQNMINDIDLLHQQIQDIGVQRELELKIKDQLCEERLGSMRIKSESSMVDTKNKLYQMQKIIEVQQHQLLELEITREDVSMKLSDIHKIAQHQKEEGDSLRSTLNSLQHQKSIEDEAKDEVKRRDVSQLRQYYETINEQMIYEVKGLQAMLDQKSKECDEWRTSFIRQRK